MRGVKESHLSVCRGVAPCQLLPDGEGVVQLGPCMTKAQAGNETSPE